MSVSMVSFPWAPWEDGAWLESFTGKKEREIKEVTIHK